ncbi:NAD-dependent epimerase/dehydratase family protein [Kitasatospora sp. MAP5-34]|uniref:NAD-dependent epimerase/dehydratase family protein n=1 Tax=Kitasatospora sp. MAP5-34 TaxID=3035102 RepID=UPI00247534D0|nr:NAD-dependent epimerase/dehydratase family protein [Kitasatospora sp. MAP5-34]MDH6578148.1 dihydroflavonol-4-reductase [Kitasatospora sp. MAP5-34]
MTGATGFIGRILLRHLAERGYETTVLVRDRGRLRADAEAVRVVEGDLRTGRGLDEAVKGVDRVLHLAGVIKTLRPGEYAEVNTAGTGRLCAALAAAPSPPRLVYCSSLAAAGPSLPGRPRREDDPPAPVSAYGRSKLGGERVLHRLADHLPGVVVRPPIVYGPGDREFLPVLAAAVRRGLVPTCGPGPHHYSVIHVDDLCRALLAAADADVRVGPEGTTEGIFQVSDGFHYRLADLTAAVAAAVGCRPPRLLPVPVAVATAVALGADLAGRARGTASIFSRDKVRELRHSTWTCATDRAARELGFSPAVTLSAGLAEAACAATRAGSSGSPQGTAHHRGVDPENGG